MEAKTSDIRFNMLDKEYFKSHNWKLKRKIMIKKEDKINIFKSHNWKLKLSLFFFFVKMMNAFKSHNWKLKPGIKIGDEIYPIEL